MGLLDVFNVRKKLAEVVNKENFDAVVDFTKDKIKEQVKEKVDGSEKMDRVVEAVIAFIKSKIHSDNKIVQWIIDNILIANVRTICQTIYNLLKEHIKNL